MEGRHQHGFQDPGPQQRRDEPRAVDRKEVVDQQVRQRQQHERGGEDTEEGTDRRVLAAVGKQYQAREQRVDRRQDDADRGQEQQR